MSGFLELNQRVKESQGQAEVIFVGDSITEGWEGNGKAVWAKYYAPRHALNLGIGSDHTQHVLWRLDHGNLDGLKPKVAVVLIGVNNIPADTNTPRQVLEGVTAVVKKIREKLPQTKVLLLGIFPFREDFCAQRAKALQVNQALHKLDDGQWIRFLDFGYLFLQPDGRISKDIDARLPASLPQRLPSLGRSHGTRRWPPCSERNPSPRNQGAFHFLGQPILILILIHSRPIEIA